MENGYFPKNEYDLPIGLGLAFAQNFNALTCFASLPDNEKGEIIGKASKVKSKEEMRELAESVAENETVNNMTNDKKTK